MQEARGQAAELARPGDGATQLPVLGGTTDHRTLLKCCLGTATHSQ